MKKRVSDPSSYQLQYLQELDSEVRWQTSQLTNNLNVKVYGIFRLMYPLTNEKRLITMHTNQFKYTGKLYVEKWLYLDLSSIDSYEIIHCIKQHGDAIAEHVREEIQRDFAELVQLTKKLTQYTDIEQGFEYDTIFNVLTLKQFRVRQIKLKGGMLLAETDQGEIHIQPNYEFLEPVRYRLIKLYEDILKNIKKAKMNNQKVLEEMERVTLPYRLSKALSS